MYAMTESINVSLRANKCMWGACRAQVWQHTHTHTCIHTYIHAYIHKRIYVCTYSAPRKLRFAQGFPMIRVVHIFHRPTATSSSTSARGCRQAASQLAASAATCGQTVYVQYAELLSTLYQPYWSFRTSRWENSNCGFW